MIVMSEAQTGSTRADPGSRWGGVLRWCFGLGVLLPVRIILVYGLLQAVTNRVPYIDTFEYLTGREVEGVRGQSSPEQFLERRGGARVAGEPSSRFTSLELVAAWRE